MILVTSAIGSQAIRHKVMGPSGMSKDMRHETYVVCSFLYWRICFAIL